MKHVLIIADGAADHPLGSLNGLTPLEAAAKPHTDALARMGISGTVATTPPSFGAGSDICCLSLLGYDPSKYHRGRSPLEAAAMGIDLGPDDWVHRCNLVTIEKGIMIDHSADHIPSAEGKRLLLDLSREVDLPGLVFHAGVSYRNLLTDSGGRSYADLKTTPPHDIPGEPVEEHLPRGEHGAGLLRDIIAQSGDLFARHEVNQERVSRGRRPATHVWLWGGGQKPQMPPFFSMRGLRGGVITAVDLLAGIGALIGFERIAVPGITGYHDTNYAGKGRRAIEALDRLDLVVVHVEAPDEASHQGDAPTKIASIEAIDRHIVGPLLDHLRKRESNGEAWRILYLPDHYTCVETRKHDATPVPFCLAGRGWETGTEKAPRFSEKLAASTGLHLEKGHELMPLFLKSVC